jgi:hypothetical protein
MTGGVARKEIGVENGLSRNPGKREVERADTHRRNQAHERSFASRALLPRREAIFAGRSKNPALTSGR